MSAIGRAHYTCLRKGPSHRNHSPQLGTGDDDSQLLHVNTHAAGPAGALPLTPEMLLTEPSGNLFGLTQNAGMGWEPIAPARSRVPDPEHAWRPARGKRRSHRAWLSHRPLGSGPAGGRSRARTEIAARHALRGSVHRSLRRPHAGHDGHDGLAALSQRCRDRCCAA